MESKQRSYVLQGELMEIYRNYYWTEWW